MDWTPHQISHTQRLVEGGAEAARILNRRVFNQPEFKTWTNEALLVSVSCLAAAYARGVQLPKDDFLLLCSTAYDMIRVDLPKEGG